jgi:hypothetical protein
MITIALAVACWCSPAAATYQLEVTAWIDGYSQLIIQGNTVQWHNISWTVPGWESPLSDQPTTLKTADMDVQWHPKWLGYTGNQWSDQFTGLNQAMAAIDQTVSFSWSGRQNAFISQQPSAGNNYTLIVDFDDNAPGGAFWYTATLGYTPVPLPPSALLLGSGLLGLAGWRKFRKV